MSDRLRVGYLALLLCGACGDDGDNRGDSGPQRGSSTELRDDTPLGKLSAAQRQSLCEEFEEEEEPVVDTYDEALCTWRGLLAFALEVGTCTEFRDACLQDEEEEEEEEDEEEDDVDDCALTPRVTCTNVTVRELRECNTAVIARDKRAGEAVTDLKLTCDSEIPLELDTDLPAVCQVLLEKCPALAIEEQLD